MQKTKEELLKMCEKGIKNPSSFYNNPAINYTGKTKDTNELDSEIIADFIIKNKKVFDTIEKIKRQNNTYDMDSHDGKYNDDSNRTEENLAKKLLGVRGNFGIILAYQIPLKNKQKDKAGKIDLLSVNFKEKKIYALELKKKDNKETMLRCAMEIYTYVKIIDKDKLFSDFGFPKDYKLCPATLTFYGKKQYNDYYDNENKSVNHLMKQFDIKPFFIDEIKEEKNSFYKEV